MVLLTLSTLAWSVISDLVLNDYVYAQINQSGQNTIFTNNMSTGTISNTTGTTGIMKNTSGMLDDAFDALRDTFGSFFGK
jgi:hypothetical protein